MSQANANDSLRTECTFVVRSLDSILMKQGFEYPDRLGLLAVEQTAGCIIILKFSVILIFPGSGGPRLREY